MEHYLDNAATTAVLPRAREAALSAMDQFGNPGSLHAMGQPERCWKTAAAGWRRPWA